MSSVTMASNRRALASIRIPAWTLLTAVLAISLAGPPEAAADMAKERMKLFEKALTPGALEKCETRLKLLKPGQALTAEACGLQYFELKGRGEVDVVAVADGWIPSLSGNAYGAATKLGRYCARDSAYVWGEHLFGYVSEGVTLVPRHRVVIRATLISDDDYVRRKKERSVAELSVQGQEQPLHFADPVIMEIQEIPVTGGGEASKAKKSEIKDFAKLYEELCSESKYQEAQRLIDDLPVGTRVFDVWTKLGAVLITFDYGQNFALLMKGYLNEDPLAPWTFSTSDARYEVWTFGTSIKGKAAPQRSVVFRNDALDRVQPYASREALTKSLAE